jgi:hypothetical protein
VYIEFISIFIDMIAKSETGCGANRSPGLFRMLCENRSRRPANLRIRRQDYVEEEKALAKENLPNGRSETLHSTLTDFAS